LHWFKGVYDLANSANHTIESPHDGLYYRFKLNIILLSVMYLTHQLKIE
jgi:hypothetical protein